MHDSIDDGDGCLLATPAGDECAPLARVFPLVYEELRRIAHRALGAPR